MQTWKTYLRKEFLVKKGVKMMQTKVDSALLREKNLTFLLQYGIVYWVGYMYMRE